MSSIHLIGGGWEPAFAATVYAGFLREAAGAAPDGRTPTIGCVVLDEGDGAEQFGRWAAVLSSVAPCRPVPVLVPMGGQLHAGVLEGLDGLLVCGGLTPGYAAAITPVADRLTSWLRTGDRPYAGFSAGAAIAPSTALVGGWLAEGVPICPDDAAEDLDDLTVTEGLGLVPFTVDVHCTQWGTLTRLIELARADPDVAGAGIDENTVLIVGADHAAVRGRGQVWRVTGADGSATVTPFREGQQFPL